MKSSDNRKFRLVSHVHGTTTADLDDIQEQLLQMVEDAMNELWPSDRPAPRSLYKLQDAVWTLVDWTSRTQRGRAQMRKRITRLVASIGEEERTPLTEDSDAIKIVPGLLAIMRGEDEAVLTAVQETPLSPGDATGLMNELDTWLAAGGDSEN